MDDEPKKGARVRGGGPQKILKKDKYDALIIVIDCGKNMEEFESNGASSFVCAVETVDWILSRKIFTEARDKINVILFGSRSTNNSLNRKGVEVKDEQLLPVEFDHIKYLQNEVGVTDEAGNVVDALTVAVDTLKIQVEGDAAVENKSILFISNAKTPPDGAEQLTHIARGIQALGANLVVLGVDDGDSSDGPSCAGSLRDLVESVDGDILSFKDACSALHNFSHKKVAGRVIRKRWEVAPGVFLPLAMYVRSMTAKNPLKAVFVNEQGGQMKREQQFFVKTEDSQWEGQPAKIDSAEKWNGDKEFLEVDESLKKVEKEDLVYGYLFGKSKVVLTNEDMAEFNDHNFNEGETGGCLKLIQFTKSRNIPPSYFIGNSSLTVLPGYDKKSKGRDERLMKLTLSLIETMLKEDVVAICRYAYNANFHLQLMALIPRREETGQIYLTGLRLPFMDDWRPFALPDISLRGADPSSTQLDLIDDFINTMDLSKTDVSYDKVVNPFFQRQCSLMKIKAMNKLGSGDDQALENSLQPSVFLKRSLEPNPSITHSGQFQKVSAAIPENFQLQEVVRTKRVKKDVEAVNKDFLKGIDDEGEDDLEESAVKPEIVLPDPEGPQKKFWLKVRKALEDDGSTINTWMNNVASDMSLFSDDSMVAVERFKILRMEMLAANRVTDFNSWMMSLHGNDDYDDFFTFMDSQTESSLITSMESPDSWYSSVDAEMFWSGMLDEDKKK